MKKKLSLLLALALLFACLTACGLAAPGSTPEPEETAAPEAPSEPKKEPDRYDLAFAQYAPEEVVMTINGQSVTWKEYFYWIYSIAYQLHQMSEIDWSADLDGVYTYQTYAQQYAENALTQYSVIAQKAGELGLEISAEEQADIDAIYAEDVEQFGGGDEAAFDEYLAENHVPRDMYDSMNSASVHYMNVFEHYFGVMGAALPDEDVLSYARDAGYMHAKHILLKTVDDTGEPLSDEEVGAARSRAEDILSQLAGLSGAELEEKFDELMLANSEDGGLAYYPDGYYFLPGEMVQPFEDAVLSLADGKVSPEPVESNFGYHIILRLPLNLDEEIDYSGYSLRYIAASALFENMSMEWFDDAEIVYSDEFADLDFNELFGSAGEETAPDTE